jgi:cytochrome c-type biogenesis protein
MGSAVGIGAALGAGVLTFLSPCVLPLIPGYIALITGLSGREAPDGPATTRRVLVPALLFVIGFSTVFVALGASASALGSFLSANRLLFERIAGIAVITLGVLMLGIIRVPWLYGEARFDLARARRFGPAAALVMGMAFAFGWSPCVGPILGSVLMLAMDSGQASRGALLLGAYSAGLAIPFLAVALALGRAKPLLSWLSRRTLVLNRVAGGVLISLGLLILTGWLAPLVGFLSRFIPKIGG